MSSDERVAHVEGRVEGQAQMLTDTGTRLVGLDQKFDLRFTALEGKLDERFTALEGKVDDRFAAAERKFDGRLTTLERRFDGRLATLERKFDGRFATLETQFVALQIRFGDLEQKTDRKIDALDLKVSSTFRWLVGIQFTILVALLASFIEG